MTYDNDELRFLSVSKLYDDRTKLLEFVRTVRDSGQPPLVAAAEEILDAIEDW